MVIKNSKNWTENTYKAYLIAVLGVGVAWFIRLQLHPVLQSNLPIIFFIINTIFIAYKFGFRPAILTVLISIPLGYFFFIPPFNSFELNDPMDMLTIFIYLLFFLVTVFIIEKLQRERYRAALIARVCESRMHIMAKLSSTANRRINRDAAL